MQPEQIFLIVWLIFAVTIISIFLVNGKKSIKKFPKLNESNFKYVENSVSGYSTQSFKTKMGGARNVLQIRITQDELWLKTNTFMAWIAEQFDLLHIIPIKSIKSVKTDGKKINLEFQKNGQTKKIVLISKRKDELIQLLNIEMDKIMTV
ncbi:hypothetical protein [Maribacter forsetii]|uniref:hypothetical protein n=1 Tax=Maribacter forsetii TaxID=444515 RepID=UPI00056B8960|nr:hypothetical protein [Maribacter forsetii]